VVPSSNEEDEEEEEEEGNEISQRVTTSKMTTSKSSSGSGSVESSTLSITQPPLSQSIEEVATTIITPVTIVNQALEESTNPIEAPTTTEKVISVTLSTPTVALPIKQSRRSNEIDDDSTSDGWDNKLNDLVNQVVEGIAEELDKSNIDDVVFKATSTTTTPKTTTTSPTKKSKKKTSIKPKPSSKSKTSLSPNKKKQQKIKTTTTTTTTTSTTKKPLKSKINKPSKKNDKKTTPIIDSVELERDVLDYREGISY
jgi:hypothetical protein